MFSIVIYIIGLSSRQMRSDNKPKVASLLNETFVLLSVDNKIICDVFLGTCAKRHNNHDI